jgi:hypothetical protein
MNKDHPLYQLAEKLLKSAEEGNVQEIRQGYTLKKSCGHPWIVEPYYIFSVGQDGICEYHLVRHITDLMVWLQRNGR